MEPLVSPGASSLWTCQLPVCLGSRVNGAGGGKGTYTGNAAGTSKGESKGKWTSKAAKGGSDCQATRKVDGGPTRPLRTHSFVIRCVSMLC